MGTRLKPLTNNRPKCLLPINGKPLLYIWLDLLEREGIEEVIINMHYLPNLIEDAINNRINRIKIKLFHESNLLGSGGTIFANKDFVKDEENFFVLYSDNLTNISLSYIYHFHKSVNSIFTTYAYETKVPKQKGIFVVDGNGKVLEFEEKPENPKTNIANAGLGILNKRIFDYFENNETTSDFGKDIMPKLIGKMYIIKSDCYIRDIGTIEDYEGAQEDWKKITDSK